MTASRQTGLPRLASLLLHFALPLAVIAAALYIQFSDPQFRARIRNNAFDQLQSLSPLSYRPELPVRVVALDEASLSSIGQWPWPRTVMAEIVDRLNEMGARVIALDMVLSEPDRTSPEQVAAFWPNKPALRDMLRQMPSHDRILAESFARGQVEIGFPLDPSAAPPPPRANFKVSGGSPSDWLHNFNGGLASLPILTGATLGSGSISLEPGGDGVLRAIPLLYQIRGQLYPGFALEALRMFIGIDDIDLKIASSMSEGHEPGIVGVGLADQAFLPTAPDGQVWLHFRRLAPDRYLSAQDVLAGKIDPALVKDHIVFIGATAKGLGDNIYSPLGELVPGIEGHVQLVEQLLTGDTLARPAWENDLLVATLLSAWLLLWFTLSRFRPAWSVLLALLLLGGLFALSWQLFTAHHLLLDPYYPALAVSALFASLVVPRYLQTEREQRWIRDAFSRYVSPNRVKYLQENPQQLELGATYRECSFVMTDLAGFTALMEKHEPAQFTALLNEYLERMVEIAFRHEGTLDRIVGDAVAVMFSAPITQPDHAARALACALDMDAFAEGFSREKQAQGIPFGKTRIGVHSGSVLVGNFGGKAMLDYRALGDPINTASRLESINKQLGTRLCVSGATASQCPDFTGRPAGELVLKGKTEAVETFEPLTAAQMQEPRIVEYLAAYELMKRESPDAEQAFRRLAEKCPDDALAAYHARRLAEGERGSRIVMTSK